MNLHCKTTFEYQTESINKQLLFCLYYATTPVCSANCEGLWSVNSGGGVPIFLTDESQAENQMKMKEVEWSHP